LLGWVDTELLRNFHADVNQDPEATVPSWQVGPPWTRTVEFKSPFKAPKVLERFVGSAEGIRVVESQRFELTQAQHIQIESIPVPQISGGGAFSSIATLTMSDEAPGSCLIHGVVRVSATGPYGLTSTIESFMASAAQTSLREFLDYCSEYIENLKASGGLEIAVAAARLAAKRTGMPKLPTPPALPPSAAAEEEEEEQPVAVFYDATELPSLAAALPPNVDPGSATVESIFLAIAYVAKTTDQNLCLLEALDARLARLEQAQKARCRSTWTGWLMSSSTVRQSLLLTTLVGVAGTSALITRFMLTRPRMQ
jgi:hypothetical protein